MIILLLRTFVIESEPPFLILPSNSSRFLLPPCSSHFGYERSTLATKLCHSYLQGRVLSSGGEVRLTLQKTQHCVRNDYLIWEASKIKFLANCMTPEFDLAVEKIRYLFSLDTLYRARKIGSGASKLLMLLSKRR